ncbi:MAG TPA: GNAT family N-acetyltransferase [Acidimicrobiia bacterium]|nr:GNAT family N-acetyltransferase [Acidimicrobiia bacterium]
MTGERELGAEETHLAWGPMKALRPHLASGDEFVARVNRHQRPEGYRLVGLFADGHDGGAVAAAGFRRLHNLAWGDLLYIDDLVTLESHRGRGHAHRLLEWVVAEARRLGCLQVHLDSAPFRHDAHRLYLNEGFRISSFHFSREV